jgi:hypothetical protein
VKKFIFIFAFMLMVLASAGAKAADCSAYTYCPNLDLNVYCETWGYGCTWYVQPYQYVRCTGLDPLGRWVDIVRSCY